MQTLIFAQVKLSAWVRHQGTFRGWQQQEGSRHRWALPFERIWNSSDDTEGAGSTIVMAMLFNTVILLSSSRIKVLSLCSLFFMCVWVHVEGGQRCVCMLGGVVLTVDPRKRPPVNYRSVPLNLWWHLLLYCRFLCCTNKTLKTETGKSRDTQNSWQGPELTLQEILHFLPIGGSREGWGISNILFCFPLT